MSSKKTALLVFALSVEEELKRKPFMKAGDLVISLDRYTRRVTKKSGLPVFYVDETKQQGDSFGAKLSNAFQSVFDQGFDAVVAIGNDCPQLQESHIHQATHHLIFGKPVLGPSVDGGFYLIGLCRQHFDQDTFSKYAWNTRGVAAELRDDFTKRRFQPTELDRLHDIDHLSVLKDIPTLETEDLTLRNIIRSLGQELPDFDLITSLSLLGLVQQITKNKGSPFALINS